MQIIYNVEELKKCVLDKKLKGQSVGFVPTMGALHEGHLSLIRQSKIQTDVTVCSIFVNPTQFNDSADFEKYPIKTQEDLAFLSQEGCDIVFIPSVFLAAFVSLTSVRAHAASITPILAILSMNLSLTSHFDPNLDDGVFM